VTRQSEDPGLCGSSTTTPGGCRDGVSIVIPVYNSAGILPKLLARLAEVLPPIAPEFEVILVNDGSKDDSWARMTEHCGRRWLRAINLLRNYGQHNALLCGIREARYRVIVTMDDDLQHPPEEIPKLLAKLQEGHDVVYGYSTERRHDRLRDLASRITKLALQTVMGVQAARHVSAFRAFRSEVAGAFAGYHGHLVSIDVLLTWGTRSFAAVPVRHERRLEGESHYTVRKLITHALNMITGFSVLPLQLASVTGFTFTLFGLGVLVYVVARYLIQGGSVPGFPFLASIIAIFAGAQLFALGIIGEYLARMHYRSMSRPPYVVRSRLAGDEGAEEFRPPLATAGGGGDRDAGSAQDSASAPERGDRV
jgi:glycosyltransferase involved in cell wall biosynthesis